MASNTFVLNVLVFFRNYYSLHIWRRYSNIAHDIGVKRQLMGHNLLNTTGLLTVVNEKKLSHFKLLVH